MKKKLIIALMAIVTTASAMAQTRVEDFLQPYPAGQKNLPTSNFTGDVWLSPVIKTDCLNLPAINVTFAPCCINSWHYHTGGQVLVATAGTGYYQEQGKPARRLHAGDIVEIAPGVVHWHGAAPDSWFAHVAVIPNSKTNKTVWQNPVGEAAYLAAIKVSNTQKAAVDNSLTARERAIIALGSYTGKGDLNGLRGAITSGFEAGMTQNEIKEVLIHAYAYGGFPRSLRAIQTMMEVVEAREAKGINDPVGREASAIKAKGNKYQRGANILAELTGVPAGNKRAGYTAFAPAIDTFLKEHLFADIFERDLLTYRERELATVSILAGVGGVEPMLHAHMGICLHLGITPNQLDKLIDIIEFNLGRQYSAPVRKVYDTLTNKG